MTNVAERKPEKGWVRCYQVGHPEMPTVPVQAEDFPAATVEAAKLWGVPWARVAAECTMVGKFDSKKGLCLRCKKVMFNRPEKYCEACERIMKIDRDNIARRIRNSYREEARERRKAEC